ncbi:Steroid 17-alpha-hydroxylase/17,20 lyase [Lamellibrachia satsuma]|nr:Steroid 17-alpha-hydroxylase/17,20 lyase [Lamellibrachia satsuma]
METIQQLLGTLNSQVIGAAAVATGAALWWFRPGQKDYNLPPSPYWTLPLVGDIFQLMQMKKYSYETFYELSKTKEYNKLFMIHLGPKPVLLLNHIDVTLEALVTKMNDFAGRPKLYSGLLLSDGGKDIMFGDYSPTWKFHRKVAHTAMKKFAFGKRLETLVQKSVSKTIVEMEQKRDATLSIRPVMMLLVFNISCGMAYGKEYDFDDPDFQKFVNITADFVEILGYGLPGDLHPWLHYLPSAKYRKMMEWINVFMGFMKERHQECKDNFDPSDPKSITDCLLQTQKEAEEEEKEMKDVLTDTHIMMTTMDLFGAGIDTVTTMLIQFVAYMIQNPDIQERVYKEIDNALGQIFIQLRRTVAMWGDQACPRFGKQSTMGLKQAF